MAQIPHAPQPVLPSSYDEEFFESYQDATVLPPPYKRAPTERIFVNRDTNLDSITHVGFDMDYTLAVYNSPLYEQITYNLAVERLIGMGYPSEISELKYDENFAIRGLFIDNVLGNILKIDSFGYIYHVVHGRKPLSHDEKRASYPSMQVPSDEIGKRFHPMNTLFNLVDACLYADLVTYLEAQSSIHVFSEESSESEKLHSSSQEKIDISYTNLYMDVRAAIDHIHQIGQLKKVTIERLEELVEKKPDLSVLLHRLRQAGKKTFLLTNSGFDYTNKLMNYMLSGFNEKYTDWKQYFDYIIVGANKPTFFNNGTTMREVDLETGQLKLGNIRKFEEDKIYNGGSMDVFARMAGVSGPEVLYCGDHIFSDIIVSKKKHLWRNLLVVRELKHEIDSWATIKDTYVHLENLQFMFADVYRGLDSTSTRPPDVDALSNRIKTTARKLNELFNPHFGSLFKSGSKPSFFAMQVQRYADLYCIGFENLLSYPFFYYFTSASILLPHEIQLKDKITSEVVPRGIQEEAENAEEKK